MSQAGTFEKPKLAEQNITPGLIQGDPFIPG